MGAQTFEGKSNNHIPIALSLKGLGLDFPSASASSNSTKQEAMVCPAGRGRPVKRRTNGRWVARVGWPGGAMSCQ